MGDFPANPLCQQSHSKSPAAVVITGQNSQTPRYWTSSKKAIITVANDMVVATVLDANSAVFCTYARPPRASGSKSAIPLVRLPIEKPMIR